MRWQPGALSAAHDHGDAAGVIHVVAGGVEERTLVPTADGFAVTATRTATAPAILRVERGVIHDMRAIGEAVTLHVYDPPVEAMRVYDPDRLAVLTVNDDAGAWLPVGDGQVVSREAWPVGA
jgi:predicted metal-dependent enzyme (double-stranded beta helix superfamily)